jgi:DNA-binding transcriptional LysR family regulator
MFRYDPSGKQILMLDGLSLDQIRAFIAAADTGSFSAAARRLNRAQSVVSQTIAGLEAQLRVPLFDRSGRYPVLTGQGRQILADARVVAAGIDQLKARAKGMADGLEPELSVVIDVMFPMAVLTYAAARFSEVFPTTPLRLYVEALGGVAGAVLDRNCGLGVMGSLAVETPELVTERLIGVQMVMVAAAVHPLAALAGPVPVAELARHIQLVLTDRTELSKGKQFAVFSPRIWRLADLGAKHEFLRAGLGWGGMPLHMVERELADGTLVRLEPEDPPAEGMVMPISAIYRVDSPPGPAGRWLIDQLRTTTALCPGQPAAAEAA